MQVVPILAHQTSNFSNLFTQNTLENPSKIHSVGAVNNFQTFQASMVSVNVLQSSQSKDDLCSQKNMNQLTADNKQADNQVNDKQQVITPCRQRHNSDVTSHICWFCKELPKAGDPFLCNCKCQGSNLIHAACLMKIAEDEIKKKKKSKKSKKDLVTEHSCSICKYKFKSIIKYTLRFDFSVTINNFVLILLGLISLSFSIALIIICYKAFFKVIPKQLELISDIKDKLIIYLYDQEKETYFYDQTLSLSLYQKENKTIPQTINTQHKSPNQKNDIQYFNIQEQQL
ncbi:transmembrane protein, putative (macronuclear) [Tetrahymena thermophila SB210]|uniref:Transmembrane protein, putative n=1 Tax=Tetrahymena thermophila (strain SB210) TaxID=312017 RepID=Q22TK3_TETTS|nr:transmembrane protein, putative [Tetrahymena thermophila SB210]EAR88435.2 transmembrane protein, putative [Tetrahymena thermophila SB210]|eukprot:XP_001008680.2 transmembrane protein, putative [Tetrahymena thermophila SB210]